ncbi:MAG: Mur ligase family protein [Chitinophagales bacterium]|nr:Mur ligase family protein [Chitinophagales bacterium]MDW8419787.1 Mur ligase family protein [Chitinophagales bacterium]
MKVHFIAIGGAVMHNLAIVLHRKGYVVSGSDDVINDPSRSNLEREGLLPQRLGFHEDNIHSNLDAVILGMHAREDNVELRRALELGLRVYSFPEYIYEVSKKKQRVVVAGSHGKTTITAMIMHVLKHAGFSFDYLVGARVEGFDTSVKISEDAPVIILEGDEYFASPIHRKPKFLYYKPHAAVISGIAWDHINVFPEYDEYVRQFELFAQSVEEWGFLTWYAHDDELKKIFNTFEAKVRTRPYDIHPHTICGGITYLSTGFGEIPLKIFGEHNLQNISAAKNVCLELGVPDDEFYRAISTFEGAALRLQLLGRNDYSAVYRDFAHSPSKLAATVRAMKRQYPQRHLVAVMELHTFSSLDKRFLTEYSGAFDEADEPIIFIHHDTLLQKRVDEIDEAYIQETFGNSAIRVFYKPEELHNYLLQKKWAEKNLLLMTSGNFGGLPITEIAQHITSQTHHS